MQPEIAINEQWQEAQQWERAWWLGNPDRHAEEVAKSSALAKLLMIPNVRGLRVLDMGCGPLSLLLRHPAGEGVALDPLNFGPELEARYAAAGIRRVISKAEHFDEQGFDEVWIYNCLQHTEDPIEILHVAARVGKRIRLFEWINIPPYQGHLQTITAGMVRHSLEHAGMHAVMFSTGVLNMPEPCHLNGEFVSCIYEA